MANGTNHLQLPKYWSFFSWILRFFNIWGVLPLTITTDRKGSRPFVVRFSKLGFATACVFFVLTFVHGIWGPAMMRAIGKWYYSSNLTEKLSQSGANRTVSKMPLPNEKIMFIKRTLYPILNFGTPITARFLSISTVAAGVPTAVRNLYLTDRILCPLAPHRLTNFGSLALLTTAGLALHVPLIFIHFFFIAEWSSSSVKIWETFSMFNVITGFLIELQFVLFCYNVRARFMYINDSLKALVSAEFPHEDTSGPGLKKGFFRCGGGKNIRFRQQKIFAGAAKSRTTVFRILPRVPRESILITSKAHKPDNWTRVPDGLARLQSLRRGHIILHDTMERINRIYQVQLLVSIMSSTAKILFHSYNILYQAVTITSAGRSLSCLWLSYYTFRFMVLVTFAHFTVSAAQEIKTVIGKVDWNSFQFRERKEVKMFCHHLLMRNFEFSACGLFNLNTSLISKSFSTAVTYLVIMAQLH